MTVSTGRRRGSSAALVAGLALAALLTPAQAEPPASAPVAPQVDTLFGAQFDAGSSLTQTNSVQPSPTHSIAPPVAPNPYAVGYGAVSGPNSGASYGANYGANYGAGFDPGYGAAVPLSVIETEPPPIQPKRVAGYWVNEVLPSEIMFRSYLGDPKGARMASRILHESDAGWMWELEAGGRIPLFRFGTPSGTVGRSGRPEGWQVDIEGAAFPRLNFEQDLDLDYTDFRVGLPVTYQQGDWQYKIEFYHLSSHVGDEFLIRDPTFRRVNYLRDAIRLSAGYFVNPDLRVYGETEYAWNAHGGAEPWHFQFGFDYSPAAGTIDLRRPQPFFAANVGLREEVDFGGGVNIVTGLQWRGANSDHLFRFGVEYYNGKSFQYEIFDEHEELLGVGFWFDF